MGTTSVLIFGVFGILIGLLLTLFKDFDFSNTKKGNVDVAVCVLSARNHFEYRSAIRRSWLTDIQDQNSGLQMVAKFVVGTSDCSIPPQDRLSPYNCHLWKPKLPETPSNVFMVGAKPEASSPPANVVHIIYVQVMQDLIVKRLGLLECWPLETLEDDQKVEVILYDLVTDEEISKVSFSKSQRGVHLHGYQYKSMQELLLPKGYEFTLEVELPETAPWPGGDRSHMTGNDVRWQVEELHHGMLVIQATNKDGTTSSDSQDRTFLPAVSAIFSIPDPAHLEQHLAKSEERRLNWQREMDTMEAQLQQEADTHGDIVFVEMVDVYRNLPDKVLHCHKWLARHYTPAYVIKTDDDCLLDVANIVTSLPRDQGISSVWWGNFRSGWPVERHGKWREPNYSSNVYPKFACGSGHALSYTLHSWLVSNAELLQRFQGEDVSLGIWLSALQVIYRQDDRWQCQMTCQDDMLSLPQLTEEMIWSYWNNSKHCGSPCHGC